MVDRRQRAVVVDGRRVEVQAGWEHVGVPPLLQSAGERDHPLDVVGRLRPHPRRQDVQAVEVLLEEALVPLGELPHRPALPLGGLLDLVLALVGIGQEVTNVGHVDDVVDVVALPQQRPAQRVREYVRPQVAEVATGVQVRPQEYIRTRPGSRGSNCSIRREYELKIRSGLPTGPPYRASPEWERGFRRPIVVRSAPAPEGLVENGPVR